MTTKQETKHTVNHLDMIHVTKDFVSQSRTWATNVREAILSPWIGFYGENEITSSLFIPWVNMTRAAHDRWLDMYETQTNEVLDRGSEWFKYLQS